MPTITVITLYPPPPLFLRGRSVDKVLYLGAHLNMSSEWWGQQVGRGVRGKGSLCL